MWFLEVNGKRQGPFTLDEILGLLREGEIPPETRVTGDEIQGRWIQVSDLQTVPKRPAELEKIAHEHVKTDIHEDPAVDLYDTFLAAKKHSKARAGFFRPSPETGVRSQTKLLLGLGAVIGASIWAMLKITGAPTAPFTPSAPPSASPSVGRPTFAPRAVAPSIPNYGPPPTASAPPPPPVPEPQLTHPDDSREEDLQRSEAEPSADSETQPGNPAAIREGEESQEPPPQE